MSANTRPTLEDTADEALTNIETELKGVEESLPSNVYLNVMDRVMVAKNELKRKRDDEKYVKVTYLHARAVASAGCCGGAEAQLVVSPSTTSIFRLTSDEEWPDGHSHPEGFAKGYVHQRMLKAGVIYMGQDTRFFILSHEVVEI